MKLLIRWLILALGVLLATKLVRGIECNDLLTLIVVAAVLGFFNAILKPVLLLFTLPFIVLTLGLGVILINALLFYWAGNLVNGFHVAGFWPAIGGAVVVSITNLVASMITRGPPKPPKSPARGGDVIDI
jgi:putative membrane protein